MTSENTQTPTSLFYKLLIWLNKRAQRILKETELKFEADLKKHKKENGNTCYFFYNFDPKPKREEIKEKWNKFEKETEIKGDKRDGLIKRLLTVTFLFLPVIIGGVQTLSINSNAKVMLIMLLASLGIIFTKITKSQVLSMRASGYKYHLYKIYLEKEYPKDLVPLTIRNRDQRGDENVPKKERGRSLSKRSFTDNELSIVFLIQIFYLGAIVISSFIAKGILV